MEESAMEPKIADSTGVGTSNEAKPWQSSRVQRLLMMIDGFHEELEKTLGVIDEDELQAVSSRLNAAQEALHNEQDLRRRIPDETAAALKRNQLPTRIKLNVGGKLFATSLSTLTSIKGTFFESMFGGRWSFTPEADGTFSIGRNPKGFSMVLQFLRGLHVDAKAVSDSEIGAFIEDVDYYGMPAELVEKWMGVRLNQPAEQFSSENRSGGMLVTQENLLATHRGRPYDVEWVMGDSSYERHHVIITLRICTRRAISQTWMMFGVIGQHPGAKCPYDDPTCYAITSYSRFSGGCHTGGSSQVHFGNGDIVEVEIDCMQNKLTVRNIGNTSTDSLALPEGKQWHLLVGLGHPEDSVCIVDVKSF